MLTQPEPKLVPPGGFEALAQQGIKELEQQTGHPVSGAHNLPHLRNVAALAQIVGSLLGFSEREKTLSLWSGWTHDRIRFDSEGMGGKDAKDSAAATEKIQKQMRYKGAIDITDDEIAAVYFATANHSKFPDLFGNPATRNNDPESLAEKLHVAVFVADKIEQNGVQAIKRRSSFVAGDRLKRGDLKEIGFMPGDELKVVALESMIRIAFKNPKDIYPDKLRPLVDPLYQIQEEFFIGVCKAAGLSLDDVARLLTDTKNADGKSLLEVSNVKNPLKEASDVVKIFSERTGITDEIIEQVDDDLRDSAREAVGYFSGRYEEDLDRVADEWGPKGEKSRKWQQGMVEYAQGKWVEEIKKQFAKHE